MAIPFTQFLRPHGIPTPTEIDRPANIESMAQELIAAGFQFHSEHLVTDEVSFTVEMEEDGETLLLAHEVCKNGPDVLGTVDTLVIHALHEWYQVRMSRQIKRSEKVIELAGDDPELKEHVDFLKAMIAECNPHRQN